MPHFLDIIKSQEGQQEADLMGTRSLLFNSKNIEPNTPAENRFNQTPLGQWFNKSNSLESQTVEGLLTVPSAVATLASGIGAFVLGLGEAVSTIGQDILEGGLDTVAGEAIKTALIPAFFRDDDKSNLLDAIDWSGARKEMEETMQRGTVPPVTPLAQTTTEVATSPFTLLETGLEYFGDKAGFDQNRKDALYIGSMAMVLALPKAVSQVKPIAKAYIQTAIEAYHVGRVAKAWEAINQAIKEDPFAKTVLEKETQQMFNSVTKEHQTETIRRLDEQYRDPTIPSKETLELNERSKKMMDEHEENYLKSERGSIEIGKETGKPTGVSDEAWSVKEAFDENAKRAEAESKSTMKGAFQAFRRTMVDKSGNVVAALKDTVNAELGTTVANNLSAIRGASALGLHKIQPWAYKTFKGLSFPDLQLLGEIIYAKRVIALEEFNKSSRGVAQPDLLSKDLPPIQYRHLGDFGIEAESRYKSYVNEFAQIHGVSESRARTLFERAEVYGESLKAVLDDSLNKGFISPLEHANMSNVGFYSPRQYLDMIDPVRTYPLRNKTIHIRDSGFYELSEGLDKAVQMDPRILLYNTYLRHYGRVARNEANLSLSKLAKENPSNTLGVREGRIIGKTKEGKIKYEKPPEGYKAVKYYEKGMQKELWLPEEWIGEWVTDHPEMSATLGKFLRILSGTKLLKYFATGPGNPFFFMFNLPRDIAYAWISTNGLYSAHLPIFAGQMTWDLGATLKDAVTRGGQWERMVEQGGGREFLSTEGMPGMGYEKILKGQTSLMQKTLPRIDAASKSVGAGLNFLNTTSEIWTRLAIRNAYLRKAGFKKITDPVLRLEIEKAATAAAAGYIDFSRMGSIGEVINSVFPYYNPGIQGVAGLARSAKESPAAFTYKLAQIMAAASGVYLYTKSNHPYLLDQVSPDIRNHYWVLPLGGLHFTDNDGNTRYLYMTIPKEQGAKFFASIAENATAIAVGDDPQFDSMKRLGVDSLSIIPNNSLPPTASAMAAYFHNIDTWRWDEIYKDDKVQKWLEKTEQTPSFFQIVGLQSAEFQSKLSGKNLEEVEGVSPMRLQTALSTLMTRNNAFGYGLGQAFDHTMKSLDKFPDVYDKAEETTIEKILSFPGLNRIIRMTHPYNKVRQAIQDAQKEENTIIRDQNFEFDKVVHQAILGKKTSNDVTKRAQEIAGDDMGTFDRLMERYENALTFDARDDIPDKSIWKGFKRITRAEQRAKAFYKYIKSQVRQTGKSWSEVENQNIAIAASVEGIITPATASSYGFFYYYEEIKNREGVETPHQLFKESRNKEE